MKAMDKKLTPKQNAVIWCLQNGFILITDCSMKGAIVGDTKRQYHINNGIFWRLVEMGLIYQCFRTHDYILTEKGKNIKTKPVTF